MLKKMIRLSLRYPANLGEHVESTAMFVFVEIDRTACLFPWDLPFSDWENLGAQVGIGHGS